MSAAAWRLSRERARSAARVAALARPRRVEVDARPSALTTAGRRRRSRDGSPCRARRDQRTARPWAAAASVARSSRRRAATLASGGPGAELAACPSVIRPSGRSTDDACLVGRADLGDVSGQRRRPAGSGGRQRGLAIAALCCSSSLLGGGYWTVFGDRGAVDGRRGRRPTPSPLELVSLRHERRGARLAVTGLVRNPGAGAAVDAADRGRLPVRSAGRLRHERAGRRRFLEALRRATNRRLSIAVERRPTSRAIA